MVVGPPNIVLCKIIELMKIILLWPKEATSKHSRAPFFNEINNLLKLMNCLFVC